MGSNLCKESSKEDLNALKSSSNGLTVFHFDFFNPVGKGGYGKVWKIEMKKTKKILVAKEMSKAKIVFKKSEHLVMNERKLLETIHHPFIPNMIAAFHSRDHLYLIMEYMHGGDLRYHLGLYRTFSEETTKFMVACILISLGYIHGIGVIHRDLKPENLVFDSEGYLRLTDFGIARKSNEDLTSDTSGTPGYMAPEVILRKNHSFEVDFYSLGVIVYECMVGKRPYIGANRKEIREMIISKQVRVDLNNVPNGWSQEAADFTNKLIEREAVKRLGHSYGVEELRNHPWLQNYDIKSVQERKKPSPFVILENQTYFDEAHTQKKDMIDTSQIDLDSVQHKFIGYDYPQYIDSLLPTTEG